MPGFGRRVHRWVWVAVAGVSAVVLFVSVLVFASSFGADLGNVASWASAVAGVAAVGFAASEVSRAEKRAEKERIAAGRRVSRERQHSDKLARKQRSEARRQWTTDRLLELLEAWDLCAASVFPGVSAEGRNAAVARARALISALPSHFATIAGKELGVPRTDSDHVTQVLEVEDLTKTLGRWGAGRLEIEWDLQSVQGTYRADSAFQYIMEAYTSKKEAKQAEDGS